MKTISHKGEIISMTNKDHAQMLKRFDPSEFSEKYHASNTNMHNKVACPLCEKYNVQPNSCKGCTLEKFSSDISIDRGCMVVLKRDIIGLYNQVHILMMGDGVTYLKVFKAEAVKQLNLVMDFLNQAK